jgi:NAD(P)H dehydrogenase (quinone)
MTSRPNVLITAATGYVGARVVRQLHVQGVKVAACARDRARAVAALPAGTEIRIADYEDFSSLKAAFQGVDSLLVVPSDGFAKSILGHVRNMIEAAQISRVGRIVLLSMVDIAPDSAFYFTPVYRDAESLIFASGLKWTILRSGLYSDLIRDFWLTPADKSGILSLPAGDAQVAPILRDDVALAAAKALLKDLPGEILTLTGPEALTFWEVSRVYSQVKGVPFRYESINPADYLLSLWDKVPDPWPHAFSSMLGSIREGRFGEVSRDFKSLVGRPALPFHSCLDGSR